MMSDASDMLAAALEQMDGIIAGSKALDYSNGLFDCQSPTSPFMGSLRALHLLEDLRSVLELMDTEERESLRCQIPDSTADSLAEWLQGHLELLCRTTLETQKLELMSEVSNLKLKLNTMEKDRLDFDDRFRDSEDLILEINELRYRLTELESEKLQYEKKLKSTKSLMAKLSSLKIKMGQMQYEKQRKEHKLQAMKEELAILRRQLEGKDGEMLRLQDETGFKAIASSSADPTEREKTKDNEHIEGYGECSIALISTNLVSADLEKYEVTDIEQPKRRSPDELESLNGLNEEPSYTPSPTDPEQVSESAPTDVESSQDTTKTGSQDQLDRSDNEKNTSEEVSKISEKPPMPPSATLPATTDDGSFGSRKARSSFGKGFFKIRGGKKTGSNPNLAETERQGTDHLDLAGLPQKSSNSNSTHTLPTTPESKKKSKGIKKLFGKLRRSQSTTFNLDDNLPEGEFKRGGVRATAGPRLGWSRDLQRVNNDVDAPFARWSKDQVCDWLQDQGLGLYVNMARVWISTGQTLLQASQQDLERELGIKHPLHRKKLQLALQALGSEEEDNKGKLDYNWVTRWLDDIGLPQYKTQFDEGRVDGRMLHYMTVDDLLSLKVGSVLHHLSIKRAIQVLRLNNYEPNCLRRRPSDENNISPAEISQWTNHRVMEWLRSVDLAEYAPNLRGSGVHGGLMVLEPRFNVETMALLLNIPPNKTLLRRHLATHFNLLIGSEAQQLKQECLENPDYTLLTATTKVKPRKLSFGNFGSLRKKKQEESEEYVCPMDVEMPKGRSFQKGFELQIYEDDLDRLEQMEDSEGTVRQIGAFSEGIQNLTSMLKDDEFFKEISNSPNPSVTDDESNA
eukprot:superscaffoldBa00002780_g15264